ncbi:DcaP family trimeric outer membrane transporter [Edaphosphingomonas haloaromaticamans]|uniref:Uncharacterized protein n=1 Tax=Edaphosphingomonas haloaromaticamans TaxID=653954 RepID=A0A1S1HJG4_9SPHN|nr:DcaP family trimeric outer membrane transporter [Sphingomonas haloaromaticamans]OHT20670.1 hypothetical protein BHE75_02670 [Sphingomonas haloaromaticamans]
MAILSSRQAGPALALALMCVGTGKPARAADQAAGQDNAAEVKALRGEVEQLRSLVRELKSRLDAVAPQQAALPPPGQEALGQEASGQASPAPQSPAAAGPAPTRSAGTQPPPAALPPAAIPPAGQPAPTGIASATASTAGRLGVPATRLPPRQTIGDNITGASRIDNAAPPNDPDLKGFIEIPGTETAIRIGGYAKVDAIVDPSFVGDRDEFNAGAIPFGKRVGHRATVNARGTRFTMEVRRPSVLGGSLRFYVENDFYGDGESYGFALHHAYGQLGNTYGGFGYSAFVDADVLPDTLDDWGPGAVNFLRTASVRQSFKVAPGASLTVSIERPESDLQLADPQKTVEKMPDIVLLGRLEDSRGHVQLGGLIRRISYRDSVTGDGDSATAYGVTASGSVSLFDKDLFLASVTYGAGVARYMNDLNGLGLDAAIRPDGRLRLTRMIGGTAGYTHYWSEDFRSNLVLSALKLSDGGYLDPDDIAQTRYGALNLIWSPAGSLSVGLEGLLGWQKRQNDLSRNASRIQATVKYDFVR